MKTDQVFGWIGFVVQVFLNVFEIDGISRIFAIFIFIPDCFTEIGKGFIDGKIAPAFCGNQIAKPLMKKFMGYIVFPCIAI